MSDDRLIDAEIVGEATKEEHFFFLIPLAKKKGLFDFVDPVSKLETCERQCVKFLTCETRVVCEQSGDVTQETHVSTGS